MHRCSSGSSHGGNMVGGPCSCGVLHHTQSNSSFSMLFSMPNHHKPYDHIHHETSYDHHHMYPFASPSSSVDCTLSLGTPSTRLTDNDLVSDDRRARNGERRSGNCVSNFCWDLLQPNKSSPSSQSHHKNGSRGGNINGVTNAVSGNNDPLLARRCANCDTTSTPLWRNGPRGPKSLCNACGIRFKKEERRATAAAANGGGSSVVGMEANGYHHHNSWIPHSQTQKMACFGNEFRFIEDDTVHHENDMNGIPFLSWRLNVTDRPSLVHDFTR